MRGLVLVPLLLIGFAVVPNDEPELPVEIVNTRIRHEPYFEMEGNLIAVEVHESYPEDLNGDGDSNDRVLHVFDAATNETTNLELATVGSFAPRQEFMVDAGYVALAVSENLQGGRDLDGDGQVSNQVLHLYEAATRTVRNLGVATYGARQAFLLNAGYLVYGLVERDVSTDLNGDGDTLDLVWHMYDIASATTTNLGLAAHFGDLILMEEGRMPFEVREAGEGNTDLNGDGDAEDEVVHYYEPGRDVINLGLAGVVLAFEGDWIALGVREAWQGQADLNNDGDTVEDVLHMYHIPTGTTINAELARCTGARTALDGGLLGCAVPEVLQGNTDLNGDGDTKDSVLHIFDGETQSVVNLELAACFFNPVMEYGVPRTHFFVNGEKGDVVFPVDEGGTIPSCVLHVFDRDLGATTNFGHVMSRVASDSDGELVAFEVPESQQGEDLNADGDTTDNVLHIYESSTGTVRNLGLATWDLRVGGGRALFYVIEAQQGATDLNGDGDATDSVWHVYDGASGTVINLGLRARVDFFPFWMGNRHAAMSVKEEDQDLNGDGSVGGASLHVINFPEPTVSPTLTLSVNGQSPPSRTVTTTGRARVTLDLDPGTLSDAVDWYYGIFVGGRLYFVTPGGVSTSPMPLAFHPPVSLDDAALFDVNLSPGSVIAVLFALVDDTEVVAYDAIAVVVTP